MPASDRTYQARRTTRGREGGLVETRLAIASTAASSVSSAIFWASITSPAAKARSGRKHHPTLGCVFFIKLPNVAHRALMNSVSSAGMRASDFEKAIGIKLNPLIRRQPIAKKATRTRLRSILLDKAPIECTHSARTRTIGTSAPEQKHLPYREGSNRRPSADRTAFRSLLDQTTVSRGDRRLPFGWPR